MKPPRLLFSAGDIRRTGANCAPTALAAISGITLDRAVGFGGIAYTEPMIAALESLGFRCEITNKSIAYGLIAVKWDASHHWLCVSGDRVLDNYTILARLKRGINLRSAWVSPEEWERIAGVTSKITITEAIEVER